MSNLNINIPITVDSSAMISIKEDSISRTVQELGERINTTNINQTSYNAQLNVIEDGLVQSGIDINSYSITLKSNTIAINNTLFQNGYIRANIIDANSIDTSYLVASKLDTISSNNSHIHIEGGIMEVTNPQNQMEIGIGIENGLAVMIFYENGVPVYKLGKDMFEPIK